MCCFGALCVGRFLIRLRGCPASSPECTTAADGVIVPGVAVRARDAPVPITPNAVVATRLAHTEACRVNRTACRRHAGESMTRLLVCRPGLQRRAGCAGPPHVENAIGPSHARAVGEIVTRQCKETVCQY